MTAKRFSQNLEDLLASKKRLTLADIIDKFAEKGFAMLCLLLMALPATPLPTGGITHVFEVIVLLLALELIAGRKHVWLPKKWLHRELPHSLQKSALPKFVTYIRKVEKYSKPRWSKLTHNNLFGRLVGLAILVFTVFAFISPPFSGLDTLPALGAVLVSLSILLDDIVLSVIGLVVGAVGVGLTLTLGKAVFNFL
jgi:hypothetical protein